MSFTYISRKYGRVLPLLLIEPIKAQLITVV